jgi:O-antigen ligase
VAFCFWTGLRLVADGNNRRSSGVGNPGRVADPGAEEIAWPPAGLYAHSRIATLVALALIAYVLIQMFPLPAGVVALLSPARASWEAAFREALQMPPARLLTLSVDPEGSRRALALVAAAIMAFAAGAYLVTSRTRVRRVVAVLLGVAILEALYGLAESLTGHQQVLWIPVDEEFARGTFYNRNHFAAMLSLFVPVSIGWFYYRTAAARSELEKTHLLPATSWDVLGSRQGLWLIAPALLVLGVIQSFSRGAFSSMLLGIALMFGIGARGRTTRAVSWLSVPLALAILAYGIQSDYQVVLERFGMLAEDVQQEGRTRIWNDSLGIVRDYPLFGVGLGNFPRLYMQYASVDTMWYPSQAHNEWLEALITLGAVGMSLAVVALVAFFVTTFRRIRRSGRDQPWLLGMWCGLIGLAMHCFAEFNLHIPSLAITAALFAGILAGLPPPAGRASQRRTVPDERSARRRITSRSRGAESLPADSAHLARPKRPESLISQAEERTTRRAEKQQSLRPK